jgi:hypothetical protein
MLTFPVQVVALALVSEFDLQDRNPFRFFHEGGEDDDQPRTIEKAQQAVCDSGVLDSYFPQPIRTAQLLQVRG